MNPSPPYPPASPPESPTIQSTIQTLHLHPHPEGGYYTETDRHPLQIPTPYGIRSASSSIYYFLTPLSPLGAFHRNRSRTVHTLHRGRGRYVVLHADEGGKGRASVETFVVGRGLERGERMQWVVEGGRYKASYLLPDEDEGGEEGEGEEKKKKEEEEEEEEEEGLLISETVIPGFEAEDHEFLSLGEMKEMLSPDKVREMAWMVRERERE